MRLNTYLTEITRGSGQRVLSIFKKRIPEVKKEFESKKWNIDDSSSIRILNKIFKKNNIKFKLIRKTPKTKRDYVEGGETFDDGSIEIELNKGFSQYFISNKEVFDNFDLNIVFRELFYILSHEMIHKKQMVKYDDLSNDNNGEDDEISYHSSKHEIEAYAYQAYLQYMSNEGKSSVFDYYMKKFDKNDPVRKRFLKKFYQYLDKQDRRTGGK